MDDPDEDVGWTVRLVLLAGGSCRARLLRTQGTVLHCGGEQHGNGLGGGELLLKLLGQPAGLIYMGRPAPAFQLT